MPDPTGRVSHLPDFHRGVSWKEPCRVATTANVTIATALNAGDTIDGVTLAAGDRVLVKDQSTGNQNGIYVAGASPARAYDMDQDGTTTVPAEEIAGAFVYVIAGTANAGKVFHTTNLAGGTLGSTTITWAELSTGGGFDLGWFNVMDYGAVHDNSTDDTVAIQDAIDACFAAGGGTVFFPSGIYVISGALQDTGTYNSQLEIPFNSAAGGTEDPIAIRLLGGGPNAQSNDSPLLDFAPSLSGAILRSTFAGAISGSPAVIAAGEQDVIYPDADWNWTQVTFENIEVRTPTNPKLTAIQLTSAAMVALRHVTVSTTTSAADTAMPTNANAVGIDMPYALNSNWPDELDDVFVDGYYVGVRPSEQAMGNFAVTHCRTGVQFRGGQGSPTYIRHANQFGKVLLFSCTYGLVFTGDQRWMTIGMLNIEHDTGTFATIYDIDDTSNYARGHIAWHTTDFTSGPEDNLLVNGATGLSLFGPYARRWKLNSVVDVPTGTNPSTNPAGGRRLYADSSTGHLSARTSTGTVIDYETAASASSISALGFVGEILVSDTPSTPLVFADLIQNEAQDDLVYADPG